MKKTIGIAVAAAALLALSACGGGGTSHAVCKDEKSATEYVMSWQKKMQEAMTSGKVTPEKAAAYASKMGEMTKKLEEIQKNNDYGAACKLLDDMAKELGV